MRESNIELDTDFDFGFEFGDDSQVDELETKAQKAQDKAEAMYKAIMPLLNNLKRNPEKPNIVWPDRQKKIDDFIKKLDSILKS